MESDAIGFKERKCWTSLKVTPEMQGLKPLTQALTVTQNIPQIISEQQDI